MTVIVPSRPARPIRVDGGGRIPPGGTSGQALVKSSNNDYATEWGTAAAAAAWGSITGTLASQTDLAAALSAKQDTLVSGANIKTLNGSTILGSGDLVISASAAWGGITGTLSDQTDLNSALAGKAASTHTHAQSDVTGLVSALSGKAATSHTHTASDVTDFSEAVDDRVSALLVAGTDISLSYNDASNTLTITSTASGGGGGAIEGNYMAFYPHHISNYDTYTLIGVGSLTMSGSRYTPEASVGTPLGRAQRVQVRFTGSSTTNCASVRSQYTELFTVNGPGAGIGGFKAHMLGAPSVGCTNSSHRFFMGMIEQKASLPDQNPSGMTNFVGIGYDSADSQLHIMHNDGSGSATKVALGASFPKPTSDNSVWYRLRLTAPAGTTRTIDWEVTELQTGAVASGTITTDLPATDKFVSPAAFNGVGGVSAPISLVLGNYVVYS